LAENPGGKRPLGRPRRSWENNVKIAVREIGLGGVDWTDLVQDRDQWRALVNMVLNLRTFLSSWATGFFSRRNELRGDNYCTSS
jgi:hypothetical protein